MISPRKVVTKAEAERILEQVERGATLLLACGFGDAKYCQRILEQIGCEVTDKILGPVPLRPKIAPIQFAQNARDPQFSEAWALICKTNEWEQPYSWETYTVVASRKLGSGKCIVIGDPRFLLDCNLEAEKQAWPGNVWFLQDLIGMEESNL